MDVFIMAGSLRAESFNKRLIANIKQSLISQGHQVDVGDMNEFEVPLYNQDEEDSEGHPAGALKMSERMSAADAIIFSLPEYNFSISGVFKNLIDWISRIKPSPWQDKNILLCSASPSMVGGNRGLWVARMSLESCGSLVYPNMFSLAQAHSAFEGDKLKDAQSQQRLDDTLQSFLALVEKIKA